MFIFLVAFFILKVEDAAETAYCYENVDIRSFVIFVWQCSENRELWEKVKLLEHQLATVPSGTSLMLTDQCQFGEHIDELKRKIQSQVTITSLF